MPVKRPAGGRTPALTGAIGSPLPLPDTPLCEGEGRGFPLRLAGRVSTDARRLTARMHRARGCPGTGVSSGIQGTGHHRVPGRRTEEERCQGRQPASCALLEKESVTWQILASGKRPGRTSWHREGIGEGGEAGEAGTRRELQVMGVAGEEGTQGSWRRVKVDG